MIRFVSPLRYPGSKTRLVELLARLLEKNLLVGSHMYEPFAGGASASLGLLANGFIRGATWIERDPLVYAFWKCVKEEPDALVHRIKNRKVTLRAWKRMLRLRSIEVLEEASIGELGYAGLFFNRTCFSGIIGAGPIGGLSQGSAYRLDCRFNRRALSAMILAASHLLEKVDIRFGDGIDFLETHCLAMVKHSFAYIDPPYVANGHKLYRYSFSPAQHQALAEAVLSLEVPWVLSYDNHEMVRALYSDQRASFVKTFQSLKGARFANELLVVSADFELPNLEEGNTASPRFRGRGQLLDYEAP